MKNIKIFPKDWLQLHPYKQSTPVDSYYTGVANRIHEIMEKTELINSFEGDEAKQICIRMAAYFEDVISELGMWQAFITTYKKMYDKNLPFYTPDDHYYEDEVNFEDVRFLLWHYTQQYHGLRKGTFVSPDNPANEATAHFIYDLFCSEWTTAPENTRMKQLFEDETRYENQETYEPLLFWFHYNSYLFTDSNSELKDYTQALWNENRRSQEDLNNMIMDMHQRLAYTSKTALLAMTSPQWLALILPETHPDSKFFKEVAEDSLAVIPEEVKKENKEKYDQFIQASEGKVILYYQTAEELKSFITEKAGIIPADKFRMPKEWQGQKLAIYATPEEGVQVMSMDVDLIKDENNPSYNAERAAKQALAFFIVKHCSVYFLRDMVEKGMLADAQTKSLSSPERGKAIIQDNWQFLTRYFIREYTKEESI